MTEAYRPDNSVLGYMRLGHAKLEYAFTIYQEPLGRPGNEVDLYGVSMVVDLEAHLTQFVLWASRESTNLVARRVLDKMTH